MSTIILKHQDSKFSVRQLTCEAGVGTFGPEIRDRHGERLRRDGTRWSFESRFLRNGTGWGARLIFSSRELQTMNKRICLDHSVI
jgi:hypothetical protein